MAGQEKIVLFSISPEELKKLISDTVRETLADMENTEKQPLLLSRNKARKLLHIGYSKLDSLIRDGQLYATEDGRIPYWSIEEYLHKNSEL
jgi:hypothetical protein